MWSCTRSAGVAPAAARAAATFSAAAANCSCSVAPASVPSAWWAVWPATKTSRPGAVTATWENPTGGDIGSGLRNWWAATINASGGWNCRRPCRRLGLVNSGGAPWSAARPGRGTLLGLGFEELGVVGGAHQVGLCPGFEFNGRLEAYVGLSGQQAIGVGVGVGGTGCMS